MSLSADERFARCVAFVLGPSVEGGFVNDPNDPGGATNHGITQAVLAHYRGHSVTVSDVQALSVAEAEAIYRGSYWSPVGGDGLPSGLDLIVFDASVNQGPGTAARMLQNAVHVNPDGQVGPITLAAAQSVNTEAAIIAVANLRMERYQSLEGWGTFGRGWTNRVNAAKAQALEWAQNP